MKKKRFVKKIKIILPTKKKILKKDCAIFPNMSLICVVYQIYPQTGGHLLEKTLTLWKEDDAFQKLAPQVPGIISQFKEGSMEYGPIYFLVSVANDQVVGVLMADIGYRYPMNIIYTYVVPRYRTIGIGRYMVNMAISFSHPRKKKGSLCDIYVRSVPSWSALLFWIKCGFILEAVNAESKNDKTQYWDDNLTKKVERFILAQREDERKEGKKLFDFLKKCGFSEQFLGQTLLLGINVKDEVGKVEFKTE